MRTAESILDLVGQTPMLRLSELEPAGGGELWAKLEAFNPGFSVKDRVGISLLREAAASGRLAPGGTVVEATAGNTGLALAMAGRRLGYRVILVVPEKFSQEKQRLMAALGGEVVNTPTAGGMSQAQEKAAEIARSIPDAVYVDQFANPANPAAHEHTTGPEIWHQMEGRLDAFVAGCGSGGTFTGVARFLKERAPDVELVAVEPEGSVLAGGEPGAHLIEGIGMERVHPTMDLELADAVVTIQDPEAFAWVRRLAAECGVLAGSSAGAAVAAAVAVAQRLGTGARVVTIIPDSAERYMSQRIYDRFREDEA